MNLQTYTGCKSFYIFYVDIISEDIFSIFSYVVGLGAVLLVMVKNLASTCGMKLQDEEGKVSPVIKQSELLYQKLFPSERDLETQGNVERELHRVIFELVILNKLSLSVHSAVLMRAWLTILTTHASRLHYAQKEKIYLE